MWPYGFIIPFLVSQLAMYPQCEFCLIIDCVFADGIDYESDCDPTPTNSFWEQFSIKFAQAAKGVVYYLGTNIRGLNGGAFYSGTNFALFEIPYLKQHGADRVTHIVAIILDEHGTLHVAILK